MEITQQLEGKNCPTCWIIKIDKEDLNPKVDLSIWQLN